MWQYQSPIFWRKELEPAVKRYLFYFRSTKTCLWNDYHTQAAVENFNDKSLETKEQSNAPKDKETETDSWGEHSSGQYEIDEDGKSITIMDTVWNDSDDENDPDYVLPNKNKTPINPHEDTEMKDAIDPLELQLRKDNAKPLPKEFQHYKHRNLHLSKY